MTRKFDRFLRNEGLNRIDLEEVAAGILGGRAIPLGTKLFKIRMKAPGRGKSGGYGVIAFFKIRDLLIYLVLFSKSDRENITGNEQKALKLYAKELVWLNRREIDAMVETGSLIRLPCHTEGVSNENRS